MVSDAMPGPELTAEQAAFLESLRHLTVPTPRPALLRDALVGGGIAVLFGWLAFVAGGVPGLNAIDLLIHEAGHLFFAWAPTVITAAMGDGTQVLVPLLLAALALGLRRHRLRGVICLAWAGEAAQNASVYIADAPTQRLQLVFGQLHDWAVVLGPAHCNCLDRAPLIAGAVWSFGLACVCLAFALAIGPALRHGRVRSRP